jgi:DNA-binding NtrC family response regulator
MFISERFMMKPKRILVAEDDISIQRLEKRILEDAGYEVDCADSGEAALELVKQNRYVVVVADVMMPGLDGFQLTKEIAKIYSRSVPVLLVTAMHDALAAAHEQQAKPLSTLQKPFKPQALVTAVRLLESQVKQPEERRSQAKKSKKTEKEKKSWFDKLFHPSDA